MVALKADIIVPTPLNIFNYRIDFVFLPGVNYFFGENRNTLGYTTSYQVGIGWELPLRFLQYDFGFARLSGNYFWAKNMKGWLFSLGLN